VNQQLGTPDPARMDNLATTGLEPHSSVSSLSFVTRCCERYPRLETALVCSATRVRECWRFFRGRCAPVKPAAVGQGELLIPKKPNKAAEAKTFFANERTLLHWISPVSMILSLSIALTSYGAVGSEATRATVLPVGMAMMFLSVVWLLYALHIYYKRVRSIREGDMSGFGETFGPTMIVVGMTLLCVGSMAINIYQPFSPTTTSTSTTTTMSTTTHMAQHHHHAPQPLASFLSARVANDLNQLLSDAGVKSAISQSLSYIHI
jgi:uncharacterized membrane protein YidH (DUF202 family)